MMLPGCSSYCTFTALVRSREVLKTYFSSLFFFKTSQVQGAANDTDCLSGEFSLMLSSVMYSHSICLCQNGANSKRRNVG